ncbi:MAG: hypothetical protein KAI66_03175 [Lentisphaeria bacterium]|nr:hypothetical protein [Lentisphaeria bacterium]
MFFRSMLLGLLSVLAGGCMSNRLLERAEWRTISLPQTATPADVRSIPYLPDLPKEPDQRERVLRTKGLTLDFVTYPNGGEARLPSTAHLAFTDSHLVVSLDGVQSEDYVLRANRQEKEDGHIWHDDNFEIFVDPFLSRSDYLHFIVNPLGDVYDARCYEMRVPDPKAADPSETMAVLKREVDYASGAVVPVVRGHGSWQALFHLPFAGFGLSAPPVGQVWGLNFCHTNRENEELTQWRATPGRKGFHQPRLFGALRFGEGGGRYDTEFSLEQFGFGTNHVTVRVRNGGASTDARCRVVLTNQAGRIVSEESSDRVLRSGTSVHAVAFQTPFDLRGRCRVAVKITAGNETVGYYVRNLSLGEPLSLTVPLRQIYTTDSFVEGSLALALGAGELRRGGAIRLELSGMGSSRLKSYTVPAGNLLMFRLRTKGLQPGRYRLRATYGETADCSEELNLISAPFDF